MKILFVCNGNTCRSPYMVYALQQIDSNNIYDSCGINVSSKTISLNLQNYFKNNKIDFKHQPKQINFDLFNSFDIVIALDEFVLDCIVNLFGNDKRVLSVVDIVGESIKDPFGLGFEKYIEMINTIDKFAPNILSFINNKFLNN